MPTWMLHFAPREWAFLINHGGFPPKSVANHGAIAAIVEERCRMTRRLIKYDPLNAAPTQSLPRIDISVVTHNSSRWIKGFVDSLIALDYPKDHLTVRFIDNSSTDSTVEGLWAAALRLCAAGLKVDVSLRPNRGFGAGHYVAISAGNAPYCLVTNIDLTFESGALAEVATIAAADDERVAAWELRQKPYEHPKYYDPVTGLTNWNSHSCVLLRRTAMEESGFYDEDLFMYGEDVEMSYRLRRAGFLLRYCPKAVVWHFGYQVKPLQYTGSTFANLYLRLKYGRYSDVAAVPWLALRLLCSAEVFPGSRLAVLHNLFRLVSIAPRALQGRRRGAIAFPFHVWDYGLVRDGAFVKLKALPSDGPLVSVITRTYRGRDLYLRQALLSVAHQSYPNIEHIVVEDGGNTHRSLVDEFTRATGHSIRFIGLNKVGRSKAGNTGLAATKGRYCLFLDDDDLLFCDHVEVLTGALLSNRDAVGAYALAWEVVTDTTHWQSGSYIEWTHRVPQLLRQEFNYEVLEHHNFMAIQSVLWEKRLFHERGGFEEDLDALEDWNLWIRYAWGHRFVYVPKLTSMHRTPADPALVRKRMDALDKAYPIALARAHAQIRRLDVPNTTEDQTSSDEILKTEPA